MKINQEQEYQSATHIRIFINIHDCIIKTINKNEIMVTLRKAIPLLVAPKENLVSSVRSVTKITLPSSFKTELFSGFI